MAPCVPRPPSEAPRPIHRHVTVGVKPACDGHRVGALSASKIRTGAPAVAAWPAPAPAGARIEPYRPSELQALLCGEEEADLLERLLVQSAARARGALDLAVGGGLAALTWELTGEPGGRPRDV
jgi:hypothetical protein